MFLPATKSEITKQPDFIVVTSESYVDHPSFGAALIARLIEREGFSVAILTQPQKDSDYLEYGSPKIAFLIAGGNVDSMVRNYSANLVKRKTDAYSDNGKTGNCPDRAVDVYSNALKRMFPDMPIIAGGLEASLRRLSHYDYWSNSVRHSILYTSKVDLVIYGMAEKALLELLGYAKRGIALDKVKDIDGTAYLTSIEKASKKIRWTILSGGSDKLKMLSSHNRVSSDKKTYLASFLEQSSLGGFIQKQDNEHFVVVNPPSTPPSQKELDSYYDLPFTRMPHPKYKNIPAIEEVQFSVTAHRGCFGGCSFCALNYHQGKQIISRSEQSIIKEVEAITKMANFKGYIHDIGGPTANFYGFKCDISCKEKNCIGNKPCKNLKANHEKYLSVLRAARKVPKVKKVFIRSGIRFDYLLLDESKEFFIELVKHHISGQLKVAPEHMADSALKIMNKPKSTVYKEFCNQFYATTKAEKLEQYIVPYFMASHPGTTEKDATELYNYLVGIKYMPLQVQDFYPTPSTLSTAIYYTELDPVSFKPVFVAKTEKQREIQRALLQYRKPKSRKIVDKIK